jgi:hypothetical protein
VTDVPPNFSTRRGSEALALFFAGALAFGLFAEALVFEEVALACDPFDRGAFAFLFLFLDCGLMDGAPRTAAAMRWNGG